MNTPARSAPSAIAMLLLHVAATAGTTGSLTGSAIDGATKRPLGGATVAAVSP